LRQLSNPARGHARTKYFTDQQEISSRVFRIYRELPLHYHRDSDEYLYLIFRRRHLQLDGTPYPARPGLFLTFRKGIVHGLPSIDQDRPLVVLAIGVPRRRPDDIVFVGPSSGDAKTFLARNVDQ
jgi:uncharacterized cupin superfamily protein